MEIINQFRPGQIVECRYVDMYAFQGRDHHPVRSDVGTRAQIHVIEYGSDFDPTIAGTDEDYAVLTCTVEGSDRVLQFVDGEVAIVGF